MATTISTSNIETINELYPVAGQDNDTQGFRDNFDAIKTALEEAAADIVALDSGTAKTNSANDFNGNNISEANFIATTEEVTNIGPLDSGIPEVLWSNGLYQIISIGADITLSLTGWPATGKMGKFRVAFISDNSSSTTTFNVTLSPKGGGTLKKNTAWPTDNNTITLTSAIDPVFIDFWTTDAGTTVYAEYKGAFSA